MRTPTTREGLARTILAVALLIAFGVAPAGAAPQLLTAFAGRDLGDYLQTYQQRQLTFPSNAGAPLGANPNGDRTGALQGIRQPFADVFLVGASVGTGAAFVRSFEVPQVPLFLSVTGTSLIFTDPGQPFLAVDLADANATLDSITGLTLTVDGVKLLDNLSGTSPLLAAYRTFTDSYAATITGSNGLGLPPGSYDLMGFNYAFLLDGLDLGPHTIRLQANQTFFATDANGVRTSSNRVIDVTSNITVVPEPMSALLLLTGLAGLAATRRRTLA